MPTNKPTDLGRWGAVPGAEVVNPSAQVATPPSGKQDIGWEFDAGAGTGEKPPVQWENWKGFVGYLWNKYLNDVSDALQLQGFEVSAQTVPNNTVAVKAGRILGANSAVTYAGGNSAAFDNRHATLSRIDLLYLTAAGALAIAKGTPNATPANGRQAYGGRYVIAEVTITFDAGAGVAVILAGDIADARSIQATRSAQWADFVGTFFNGGGAAPKITMYASATEFRVGVNCDANYLDTVSGELDAGFTVGRFDTGKTIAVLLFRVGDGATVATAINTLRVYFAPESWTDDGVTAIPLTISLDFGYNGAWQKRVWTGAALEDLATENFVTNRSGRQIFTSDGTWIRPTGIDFITVTMVGGGGAGGQGGIRSPDNTGFGGGGGGGGGGAVVMKLPLPVTGNVTVTVGDGGVNNEDDGTASVVSGSFGTVTADFGEGGGDGGAGADGAVHGAGGTSGAKGVSSYKTASGIFDGEGGGSGAPGSGSSNGAEGGGSWLGQFGDNGIPSPSAPTRDGDDATGYGAGGGGGAGDRADGIGDAGSGTDGIVIIEWGDA